MNLDLPVFNLKNLKRSYHTFLVVNVIVTVASLVLIPVLGNLLNPKLAGRINTWIIFGVILIANYFFSQSAKKELKSIHETPEIELQFSKYERYFKKRLIWNVISLAITGAFFVVTSKNVFFYVLIIQLILSLLFYPNKKVISRELKNEEIVFT